MGNSKRILGIDPGTRITGYGIVDADGPKVQLVDYGCIKPPADQKLSDRYYTLHQGVIEIIARHSPEILVVETQFVNKNPQSAMKLAMARAVIILAAKMNHLPVYEYSPRKAKQAVVGKGAASKEQVGSMIKLILKLKVVPTPEDASDALALAICHAQSIKFTQLVGAEI